MWITLMSEIWQKIKNFHLTISKGKPEFSKSRETGASWSREMDTSAKGSGNFGSGRPSAEIARSSEKRSPRGTGGLRSTHRQFRQRAGE